MSGRTTEPTTPPPLVRRPVWAAALIGVLTVPTALGTGGLYALLTDAVLELPLAWKPTVWGVWSAVWLLPAAQSMTAAVVGRPLLPRLGRGPDRWPLLVSTMLGGILASAFLGALIAWPFLLWLAGLGAVVAIPATPVAAWLTWRAHRALHPCSANA